MWNPMRNKSSMVSAEDALPGRDEALPTAERHHVLGTPLKGPFPDNIRTIMFGMGCFWGAERKFWELDGVYTTAVGYAGGHTPNPTYREVCSGHTGQNEVVLVAYDPEKIPLEMLLKTFWESHDPTQGMRQGNDVGTQYRSSIYITDDADREKVTDSREMFAESLNDAGFGEITTEIRNVDLDAFFYAEDYHQQYLAKNPGGYCGIGGTGVSCPIGLHDSAE